jgi:hypothetical protein
MARYRKKRALYEVMSKSRSRPAEEQRAQEPGKDESGAAKPDVPTADWVSQWRKRPRIVQFIGGRVEFSVPYPLAIAVLLGVVLLVLFAYRMGEYGVRVEPEPTLKGPQPVGGNGTEPGPKVKKPGPSGEGPDVAPVTKGDHRIVIQQFHRSRDLEEVQRYFLLHKIETVIERRGSQFFLLTKDTYENPGRAGTDGAAALRTIKRIGAGYKAPQGYDSFAPRLFSDAYGEKIK